MQTIKISNGFMVTSTNLLLILMLENSSKLFLRRLLRAGLFVVTCTSSLPLSGQDALLDFLQSAENDLLDIAIEQGQQVSDSQTWFDEPEIRIGSGTSSGPGPTERQNNYALRIRPVFPSQRIAERNLNRLGRKQQQLTYDSELNNSLRNRYFALVDMLAIQMEIELLNQELDLSNNEVEFEQSLVQTDSFNAERLQDLEVKHFQLQQQLNLETERLSMTNQLYGTSAELRTLLSTNADWLLPIDEIVTRSLANNPLRISAGINEASKNFQVRSRSLELDMEEQEYKLEQAEDAPPIKFVELKYTDKNRSRNNEAETTLSFSIPFGRYKNRFSRELRRIEEAKTNLLLSQKNVLVTINHDRSQMRLSVRQANSLETSIAFVDDRLLQSQGIGNPRMIISLRKERLDLQHQFMRLRVQSMQDYLNILHMTGQLLSKPLRNRLRADR